MSEKGREWTEHPAGSGSLTVLSLFPRWERLKIPLPVAFLYYVLYVPYVLYININIGYLGGIYRLGKFIDYMERTGTENTLI